MSIESFGLHDLLAPLNTWMKENNYDAKRLFNMADAAGKKDWSLSPDELLAAIKKRLKVDYTADDVEWMKSELRTRFKRSSPSMTSAELKQLLATPQPAYDKKKAAEDVSIGSGDARGWLVIGTESRFSRA